VAELKDNRSARNYFNVLTKVYQEAVSRAARDDAFVFLGGVFDSVNEPVYIDKWMHWHPWGMN